MDTARTRPLGSFERAEVLTGEHFAFNVVLVLRLAGTLDADTVRLALDRLQARHPLLRARVGGRGRQRRFELAAPGSIPLTEARRDDEEAWLRVVEEELGSPFEIAAGPLMRAVRVGAAEDPASELVLTIHHAIVDATSAHHLARELVAACAGAELPSPPSQRLPASADALFPLAYRGVRRWPASARFLARQAAEELSYVLRTRARRHRAGTGPARCRALSLALSESETEAVVRATRRQRVGLFATLSAAMLLAVVERLYDNRRGPQRYFGFPLLRPYLEPPVPPDVVAGYLTTLRLTLPVEPKEGLWPTAAAMHRQVDRAVKRGERFLAARWSAASMKLLLAQRGRMAATALNYAGATPLRAPAGASFTVAGLHAFVTDFLPGPEYTGQARIFDRRLWWDLVYLDVDMDRQTARAIAERMRRLVLEAAGQEASHAA